MERYKPIQNKEEYLEALSRLCTGAKFIESKTFNQLPLWKQKQAHDRYDDITKAVLIYQEMEWALDIEEERV